MMFKTAKKDKNPATSGKLKSIRDFPETFATSLVHVNDGCTETAEFECIIDRYHFEIAFIVARHISGAIKNKCKYLREMK